MLYVSSKDALSREQLASIPVPVRGSSVSDRWCGVQHGHLADTIIDRLVNRGYEVLSESWKCDKKMGAMFGSMDLTPPVDTNLTLDIGQDGNFCMGVRHDNYGAYALTFAVGATVTVCSNGVFNGEFTVKHRHTVGLKLSSLIDEAIDQYAFEALKINAFVASMRSFPLHAVTADRIIMESLRRDIISTNHIRAIDESWRKPPHPEFEDRTLWSLYNAYTEVAKEMKTTPQVTLMKGLRPLMSEILASKN